MHSLLLADTNWTVGGNVNGQASHKNHRVNLRRIYGLMQCIGTYIASYQPIKCILTHFDNILQTPACLHKIYHTFQKMCEHIQVEYGSWR